jgi:hypothetical protein
VSRPSPYTEDKFVGRVFSFLTVLRFDGVAKEKRMWVCKCSCGVEKSIAQPSLLSGATQSCGCYHKAVVRARKSRLTHGMTYKGIYNSWCSMKARCTNKENNRYYTYGGRGIKVDPAWMKFDNFLKDMGNSWREGLTIERKDVNGNYCKKNCTWIARSKQMQNMSNTRWIFYKGKRICVSEAARRSGISVRTLRNRIKSCCPKHHLFTEPHSGRPHRTL